MVSGEKATSGGDDMSRVPRLGKAMRTAEMKNYDIAN
jgi:hypothetical protein